MSVGDTSRAEDQDSLLVLLSDAVGGGSFGRGRLRKRLVDCCHCEINFRYKLWNMRAFIAGFYYGVCEHEITKISPMLIGLTRALKPRCLGARSLS